MIYSKIDLVVGQQLQPIRDRLLEVAGSIDIKQDEIKTEDSKKREAELKEEIKQLHRERFNLWNDIEAVQTEAFKDLLAEEYGLPRTHPKFEKAFAMAWEDGHSSGFSEVELHFMELVDLVK